VRLVVKKVVNKLLAQPTDSIVGMIIALVMVALLVLVWAYLGAFSEHSTIVSALREFIGQ
jgi:low affinity Fe/Cu permease